MASDAYWKPRPRMATTGEKARNILGLVYIEDLEKAGHTYGDLLAYLDGMTCQCACSPVHDKDRFTSEDVRKWCEMHIDPETGDLDTAYVDSAPYVGKPKKPHVHLVFKFKGPMTANELTERMAGLLPLRPTIWEKCLDVDSTLMYFAHMRSPQKAQYSAYDIHGFGGIDLSCLSKTNDVEKANTFRDIWQYVQDNQVKTYHTLVNIAMKTGSYDWINCIKGNGSTWRAYFQSQREERMDKAAKKRQERKDAAAAAGLIG